MKKTLVSIVAAACAFAAVAADSTSPRKSLKVLMIGNSFSICCLEEMPPVAKAMNLELDLASLYIGGCTLFRHWQNVETSATNANYRPYQFNRKVNGVKAAGGNLSIQEGLKLADWDVVTIQQGSHESWRPETYHPYGDNLVRTIHELCPRAKIVVQETWSYTPFDGRLAQWKITPDEMYAKLHNAYWDFAKKHRLEVIPTGAAVDLWRKRLPVKYGENLDFGEDVTGSVWMAKDKDGKEEQRVDRFHLNWRGHYLQALVWTAKLYGVDVTKCTYRPERLAADRAELMKKLAMEAVAAK